MLLSLRSMHAPEAAASTQVQQAERRAYPIHAQIHFGYAEATRQFWQPDKFSIFIFSGYDYHHRSTLVIVNIFFSQSFECVFQS
jgi:hypothetical protein